MFMNAWIELVASCTCGIYEKQLNQLKVSYRYNHDALTSYLNDTWLCHKYKIIQAGIKYWLHLEPTSSSKVKSEHHLIKSYLHVLIRDLKTVVN